MGINCKKVVERKVENFTFDLLILLELVHTILGRLKTVVTKRFGES